MKTTSLLIPAALAAFVVGTTPAALADEAPTKDKTDAATTKKVKPHSHAQEKTGAPAQPVTETKPAMTDAEKNERHLHPRDGK